MVIRVGRVFGELRGKGRRSQDLPAGKKRMIVLSTGRIFGPVLFMAIF